VNKKELHKRVAKALGISQAQASNTVNQVFEEIRKALAAGESVSISKFGNFFTYDAPPRKARNIQTEEVIEVPPKVRMKFRPSDTMRKSLEEGA
jgi:nucleoid DNA-binding protein